MLDQKCLTKQKYISDNVNVSCINAITKRRNQC